MNVAKALRLACWNADGFRGWKLEHFLSQHRVDMSLDRNSSERERRLSACKLRLSPNRLGPQRETEQQYWSSGIDHYTLPVLGLTQLDATAIHIILASGPPKILSVYLSISRPIVGSDLSACFGGGFPVFMAGDLNAKHADWNSRLATTRGKLLRDYASGKSCFLYRPNSHHPPV
jgi:hypothetical protein